VSGYLNVEVKHVPLIYCGISLIAAFLLEQPVIQQFTQMWLSFAWIWFTIRFLNRTIENPQQLGDQSPAFALSSFGPSQFKQHLDSASEVTWRIMNLCGLLGRLQQCCKPRAPAADPPSPSKKQDDEEMAFDTEQPLTKKEEPQESGDSLDQARKMALEKLDQEISLKIKLDEKSTLIKRDDTPTKLDDDEDEY